MPAPALRRLKGPLGAGVARMAPSRDYMEFSSMRRENTISSCCTVAFVANLNNEVKVFFSRKNFMKPRIGLTAICMLAVLAAFSSVADAATLKSGTCRGVNTPNGYKYVGTYCIDYGCTVVQTYMFDSYCPYSI